MQIDRQMERYRIKCKYSTDENIQIIIEHIYEIYEPLRQALQTYGTLKVDVKIIPIIIKRTGTFHVKTLAEICQLLSFTEEPPGRTNLQTTTPTTKRITMALHVHTQKWLSHTSKISKKILTTRQKMPQLPNLTRKTSARRHHKPWRRGRRTGTLSQRIRPTWLVGLVYRSRARSTALSTFVIRIL